LPFVQNGVARADVFDAFCHWFVAIRNGGGIPSRQGPERYADVGEWLAATIPPDTRPAVERLLASAIDLAHEQNGSCWSITWRPRRIRLNVGRLAAFTVKRHGVEFGIVEDGINTLSSKLPTDAVELSEASKAEPRAMLCALPFDVVAGHHDAISGALEAFIPMAAATALRSPHARLHSNEVIEHLSKSLGRTLPQPLVGEKASRRRAAAEPPPPAVAITHPRTLFKKVDYELSNLLSYIEIGDIALP